MVLIYFKREKNIKICYQSFEINFYLLKQAKTDSLYS